MKVCARCKIEKPKTEFSLRSPHSLNQERSYCKACASEVSGIAQQNKKETDPEAWNSYKAQSKRNQVYRKYGVTQEYIDALGDLQNWQCFICKSDIRNKPYIDHDHDTNTIRNLLCFHCNVGLGHFRDSKELLGKALIYLEVYDD